MPTVMRIGQFRFFFYSNENDEPRHVHMKAAENEAKYWLEPLEMSWNKGFNTRELKQIERHLQDNLAYLIDANIAIHARDGTDIILDRLARHQGAILLSALSLAERTGRQQRRRFSRHSRPQNGELGGSIAGATAYPCAMGRAPCLWKMRAIRSAAQRKSSSLCDCDT